MSSVDERLSALTHHSAVYSTYSKAGASRLAIGGNGPNYRWDPSLELPIPQMFTKFMHYVQQGLLGLLFSMQRHGKELTGWAIFLEIFETFQFLSFPFKYNAHFAWNPAHMGWFISLVNATVPETFILGNTTVFYVVLIILGAVLINAFTVGFYFARNQFKFVWTLPYLRFVCTMFMTILYIPVIGLFTSMLICYEDHCWSDLLLFRNIVVILVALIYIALTLTFALSVFQQDPTEESELLGRPHSRVELFQLISKTVLTVLFTALEHYHDYAWLLVGLCVFFSTTLFLAYTWYIPFYRWSISVLRTAVSALFLWASICLVIVTAIQTVDEKHAESNSIGIMFFVLLPAVFLLAYYAISTRRSRIKASEPSSINDAFLIEMKTRFILEDASLLFEQSKEAFEKPETQELLKDITDIYQNASERITNSSILYMFWSNFCLYHCKNKQRSLIVLDECMKRNPSIDERFVAFRLRRAMNEESSSENTDVLDFIICESHMKKAAKQERQALATQVQFWAELAKEDVDLRALFAMGSLINSKINLADTHYLKALQSNPHSVHVLKGYARFLEDVCNDSRRSSEVQEKIKQLEDLKQRSMSVNDGQIDFGNIISSGASGNDSAVFTINNKGCILSVNAGVKTLLGFEQPSMLIGQNISVIVPKPLSANHDKYLERHMSVGQGQVIGKLRKVFGVRADGYLIPIMILVRQMTFGREATFLGILKAAPEGLQANDYILLDEHGFIRTFTERCRYYFGNSIEDVERYQLNITDWIKNFYDLREQMTNDPNGCKMTIDAGDDNPVVELKATMASVTVSGTTGIHIIRLRPVAHPEDPDKIKSEVPMKFYVDPVKAKKERQLLSVPKAGGGKLKSPNTLRLSKASISAPVSPSPNENNHNSNSSRNTADLQPPKSPENDSTKAQVSQDSPEKSPSVREYPPSTARRSLGSQPRQSFNVKFEQSASVKDGSHGQHNDGHSSKPSQTSQTSSTMNSIMRVSFAKRVGQTSNRLRILRRALLIASIIMSVMAVIHLVLQKQRFDDYLNVMQRIGDVGDTLQQSLVILQDIREFQIAATDAKVALSAQERADTRINILAEIDNFSAKHRAIYSSVVKFQLQSAFPEISQPMLKITDITDDIILKNVSINDSIDRFASEAAKLVDSITKGNNADMSLASSIALDTIRDPLKRLIGVFMAKKQQLMIDIDFFIFYIALIPVAVIYFALSIVVGFIYYRTNSDAKLLYKLFLDVPKKVIVEMYELGVQRLDDLDKSSDGSILASASGEMTEKQNNGNIFDIVAFIKQSSVKDMKVVGSGEDVSAKNGSSEFINLQKLLRPLSVFILLTLAYFVGFTTSGFYLLNQTRDFGGRMNWAAQTGQAIQEIHYRTMMYFTNQSPTVTDTSLAAKSANVNSTLDRLESFRSALIRGSSSLQLEALMSGMESITFPGFPTPIDRVKLLFDQQSSSSVCPTLDRQFGLYNGMINFMQTAYDLTTAMNNLPSEMNATDYYKYPLAIYFRQLGRVCLPEMIENFKLSSITPIQNVDFVIHQQIMTASVVLIILFLLLTQWLVFKPLVTSIEREIALTPSMLLMLPANILIKIESIRHFTSQTSVQDK